MEVLAFISIAYLAVRLLVALINLITRTCLRPARPGEFPVVSVLIPARNEEVNIGALLDDLKLLDYPYFEVLVYDDDSYDRTAEIIKSHGKGDSRIKYLKGNGPPHDWLGKNFACDQMARQANGDYFLFIDSDVRVKPDLLNDSLAYMQKYDLHLLSVFPVQIMRSFGEWLTVPLMNRILVGNLPLSLVRKSSLVDFAAANGQFMLSKAEIYKKHWFHEEFRNEKVEDIRIIRMMKQHRYKVSTLLSAGQISCRMYQDYRDGVDGFSKNIHAFFGKNWLTLLVFVFLTTFGPFAAWLAFSIEVMLIYLVVLAIFSALISIQSRQSVWRNLLFMPLQQFTVVIISILAAYRQITGNLTWKGRKV